MAHTLRPFRDYSEHDVVNLFAYDGAQGADGVIATAGTVVKVIGNGFQPVVASTTPGGTGFLGAVPVDLAGSIGIPGLTNVVSNRYALTAKVTAASSGNAALGITLISTQELDENGEKLVFNPRKAAEKNVVVSGQGVPVLTKGIVVYSGTEISATAVVGGGVYLSNNAGELSTVDSTANGATPSNKVGTLLSKPVNGVALIKLNF